MKAYFICQIYFFIYFFNTFDGYFILIKYRSFKRNPDGTNSMSAHHPLNPGAILDEPTWRCHQNPFVGALRIQEPVILGEPQIKG